MSTKDSRWPKIRRRHYRSGRVSWQVDSGRKNGKRERKQFSTKEEAETYAAQLRIARTNEGLGAFRLIPSQRAEAEHCFDLLKETGSSLTEAVRFFLEHERRRQKSRLVSEVVASLLKEKTSRNLRPDSMKSIHGFQRAFSGTFGGRLLDDLALEELTTVCNDPLFYPSSRHRELKRLSPKTVRNRIGFLTDLYNHAFRNGWAESNLASRIRKPVKEIKEPGVLTIEQAAALLAHADEFELLPYIAMGLFAGIRRRELLKLDWTAVRLTDAEIVIGAKIAKGRSRRVIPIDPTLSAWLGLCHRQHGPIADAKQFDRNLLRLRKAAGIDQWPHNALRHSFASYHLAAHQDPDRTSYLMGHSDDPDILHNHYKGLVSSNEAKQYWDLQPGAAGIHLDPSVH